MWDWFAGDPYRVIIKNHIHDKTLVALKPEKRIYLKDKFRDGSYFYCAWSKLYEDNAIKSECPSKCLPIDLPLRSVLVL